MSTEKYTVEEFTESLTGFDEIAVRKSFGQPLWSLNETDPMTLTRALVFVAKRREGLNDSDAYNAAMSATMREVSKFFAGDNEPMPEEPVTEAGKDSATPVTQPAS